MPISTIKRFLELVWYRQPEGITFLSAKDWTTGEWSEYPRLEGFSGQPPTDVDLYFCPNSFTESRRLRKNANGGRWLYADLDEVHPLNLPDGAPFPTLAWETSPGRYQAMWLLDRELTPRRIAQLNQRLTYFTGADKGGWSLTKVLRVPGSISTKRGQDNAFDVHLLHTPSKQPISYADLSTLLKDVESSATTSNVKLPDVGDLPDRDEVWRKRRRRMPVRARQLINTRTVLTSDDRSARMWELENLLINAGLSPVETLVLVRETVWNKWAGQRRELAMLWKEINKIEVTGKEPPKTKTRKTASPTGLLPNTLDYDDFMAREWPKPSWLVEGCWTEGAYGILAGEYKSFKTMLLLDFALSVASGEPFLGRYAVNRPGPVCYIHEEGRPWSIHDRMTKIAYAKGLTDRSTSHANPDEVELSFSGRSLPIRITSLAGLSLTDEDDQHAIAKHIEQTKPRLVILETFYLLSGGASETAIEEVSPILEYLARLSHTYGTAVVMSHHFHKSKEDKRFLDRVSGSNIFGRWYESGLFVERVGEEEQNGIQIVSSHRDGKTTRSAVRVVWDSEDDTSYAYEWLEDEPASRADVAAADKVLQLGGPQSRVTTAAQWLDSLPPKEVMRLTTAIASITQVTPLSEVKATYNIPRTEYVKALAKSIVGFTVATREGVRVLIPPSERSGSAKRGPRSE